MRKAQKILRIILAMAMVLLLMAGCARVKVADKDTPKQKYVLKFNHVLAESEPFHRGLNKWAQRVSDRTNGGLEIKVFHSAQLGMEEDIIERLRQGCPVGQNTDSARLGLYIPEIAVMNAPYFADNIDDILKLRELPTVKRWERELEDRYGIKILSFSWVQGMRHMVTNRPIRTPDDLHGLRIRTPGAPIWQQSIRSLGAVPVSLPFGEVYIAIEQGAVDGADLVLRNITEAKLFEVAKYVSQTRHILLINFEVVSKKFFDSLPPEYQMILIEECNKAGLEVSREMEKEVDALKKELAAKGMTIVEDVDVEAFHEAGEDAYQALYLTDVRNTIYKELGKK